MIQLIKQPVITEKSTRLMKSDQYTFDVDLKVTKTQIKMLVKQLYQVDAISVNTHRPARKRKRLGSHQGYKASKKRAVITLKAGQSFNFSLNK